MYSHVDVKILRVVFFFVVTVFISRKRIIEIRIEF